MSANSGADPEFNDLVPKPSAGRSITLTKLLLAVGSLILLVLFLFPATRSAGPAARRSQCVNNMKQIGLALRAYEQVYHSLPPAYTVDADGRPLHSWRTLILPYLEQETLYRTIDLAKPWNDPANAKARETALHVYQCPEAVWGASNATTYRAISAPNGCFHSNEPRRLAEITDGLASTLMVIEAGEGNVVPWMAPVDADEALVIGLGQTTKLYHSGGVNACFVDGSVKFLKTETSDKVRRAMISISGNDDKDANERF